MTALAPVFVDLKLRGAEQFKKELQSLTQAVERQEKNIQKTRQASEAKAVSEAKASAKKRVDANERAYRELERDAKRWEREEIASVKRKNAAIEREEKRSAAARKATARSIASGVVGGAGRVLSTGVRVAGTLAAAVGGFSAVDATTRGLRNSAAAQTLAANSMDQKTGQQAISRDDVLRLSGKTATDTGIDQSQVIQGMDAFVAKAGGESAGRLPELLKDISEIVLATGSNLDEVMSVAGSILNTNQNMSSNDLTAMLRGAIGAGRAGAIDLRDLQTELGSYGSQAGTIAGDRGKNLANLLAIGEKAVQKGGLSSAAEATTAVERLVQNQVKSSKEFKALGINTDAGGGKSVDPIETMLKAFVATGGSQQKLLGPKGVYSDVRTQGAVRGPLIEFNEELTKQRKAGKSENEALAAAAKHVRAELDKFSNATPTATQIQTQAADAMKETQRKLQVVYEKVQQTIAGKVLPYLEKIDFDKLATGIIDVVEKLSQLASWVAENPYKALGGLLIAEVAKGFAPSVITSLLTSAFTSASAGAVGAFASVAAPVFAAAVIAGLGVAASDEKERKDRIAEAETGNIDTETAKLRSEIAAANGAPGGMTAAQQKEFKERAEKLTGRQRANAEGISDRQAGDTSFLRLETIGDNLKDIASYLGNFFDNGGATSTMGGDGSNKGWKAPSVIADEQRKLAEQESDIVNQRLDSMRKEIAASEKLVRAKEEEARRLGGGVPDPNKGAPTTDGNH